MTNKDLFDQEYARAVEKYSPDMWAELHPHHMLEALKREVEELRVALWGGEFSGPHGIEREAIHCAVVAVRIIEEMKRRAGVQEPEDAANCASYDAGLCMDCYHCDKYKRIGA